MNQDTLLLVGAMIALAILGNRVQEAEKALAIYPSAENYRAHKIWQLATIPLVIFVIIKVAPLIEPFLAPVLTSIFGANP